MAQQAQEEVEEPKPDAVARAASSLRSGLPQFLLLGSAARPAPGQPRPYEPRIATLSEARAAAHVRAVKDIAGARFGFPTDKHRDYKTYTNVPKRTMGVAMLDGSVVAYPDIVVVQDPENYAKILGEVETTETVNEQTAQRRWRPFADLTPRSWARWRRPRPSTSRPPSAAGGPSPTWRPYISTCPSATQTRR